MQCNLVNHNLCTLYYYILTAFKESYKILFFTFITEKVIEIKHILKKYRDKKILDDDVDSDSRDVPEFDDSPIGSPIGRIFCVSPNKASIIITILKIILNFFYQYLLAYLTGSKIGSKLNCKLNIIFNVNMS